MVLSWTAVGLLGSSAGGSSGYATFDLLTVPSINRALHSRSFRFAAQTVFVFFFVLVIVAGLFGSQQSGSNIATVLTWTCSVDQLFLLLTWLELGYGVTTRPELTALLAIQMFFLTFVPLFIFERQAFCRYGCLVSRISGLYALFSALSRCGWWSVLPLGRLPLSRSSPSCSRRLLHQSRGFPLPVARAILGPREQLAPLLPAGPEVFRSRAQQRLQAHLALGRAA